MRIRSITTDMLFHDHKHILTLGISGSGKTNLMESVSLDAHSTGKYKVIFFDFFKHECCQLGFPEDDREMVKIIENKFFSKPRGFKQEVLVPFAVTTFDQKKSNKMFIDLPNSQTVEDSYSHWKPFKISFSQLKTSDLFVVLRMLTESGKVSLEFLHTLKKFNSIEDLMQELIRLSSTHEMRIGFRGQEATAKVGKTEIYQAILRLLSSIQQSGFLCQEGSGFQLDLDKVMRSEEITTFTFANLDSDDFRFMVFVSILRQIKDLRAHRKYPKELLIVIPELADVAPATSKISPEAVVGSYSSLNIMQLFSRQSRILKMTLFCDTQTPKDCNRTVTDNFGWAIIGAMQQNVLRWLNENFVRIPDIPYFKIPHLSPGIYCIVPLDSRYYCYPYMARPSLARHRQRGDSVREWVAAQPGVVLQRHEDFIDNPLQVRMIYKDEQQLTQVQQQLVLAKRELKEKEREARIKAGEILKEAEKRNKVEAKRIEESVLVNIVRYLKSQGKSIREISREIGFSFHKTRKIALSLGD